MDVRPLLANTVHKYCDPASAQPMILSHSFGVLSGICAGCWERGQGGMYSTIWCHRAADRATERQVVVKPGKAALREHAGETAVACRHAYTLP